MILEGHSVSEAGKTCSDWGFGHGLECDRDRSKGSSRVWSEPIHVASVACATLGGGDGVNPEGVRGRCVSST